MPNHKSAYRPNVVIIGAGKMGNVITQLIHPKAESIIAWDVDKTKVSHDLELNDIVPKAKIIFLCVPSFAMRVAVNQLLPHVSKGAILISIAKGIEEKTNLTMAELLQKLTKNHPISFGLLSGPMLADELSKNGVGYGVFASDNQKSCLLIKKIFSDSRLFVAGCSDVRGTALVGVLKNIYALGLGMCQALNLDDNIRGWYITAALDEMRHIISLLGGKAETADTLAGLGDLIATGFSHKSRNFTVGMHLANGEWEKTSEGTRSLPAILQRLKKRTARFPLLLTIKRIAIDHQLAKPALFIHHLPV